MPNYYNLNKSEDSIKKDYQYMENHTPAMNRVITENNPDPEYGYRQGFADAAYDAAKKFSDRISVNEKVFLWKDEKDSWTKTEKYNALADKNNAELRNYSDKYTNHSARKRAGSSADASKLYRNYSFRMQELSVMAEELKTLENANTLAAIKEVKNFYKKSMEALDIRESAMKAAAEVKSTSEADERFRKAKVTRIILAQKLRLSKKYYDRYKDNPETAELADYFKEQSQHIAGWMTGFQLEYKAAYLGARGSVDRIQFEEVRQAEQAANQANAENPAGAEAQANAEAEDEHIDVRNDVNWILVDTRELTRQFGEIGANDWKTTLRYRQVKVCANKKINSVRVALEEISAQQANKYNNQLSKINHLAPAGADDVEFKRHAKKGHSYSKNDETVFRFDLLGTGASVDLKEYDIGPLVDQLLVMLNDKQPLVAAYEVRSYFIWLKSVKDHESMRDVDLDNRATYTVEFRDSQYELARRNRNLILEYFSYKLMGNKNTDRELERVNRGIRVRPPERKATEANRTVKAGNSRELITIQGCETVFGSGDFGIDATAEHMRELARVRLEPIFANWANGTARPKTIRFMMDGISRGGVDASLGAMAINGWMAEKYPQYQKYIKYDIIQRDPVPGPTTATEKDAIRFGGAAKGQGLDVYGCIKGTKYKPLSKSSSNSTVFYCLHPNVPLSSFFQPQKVYGANRIILSPFVHADDGKIPGAFDELLETTGKSRSMLNNSNGEFYAGSGVSDLDDGVYILDEYSTLTKIDSYEDVERIFNRVRNDKIYSRRKDRILEVVKAWFDEHRNEQGGNIENGR